MKLLEGIIQGLISSGRVQVEIKAPECNLEAAVENVCYKALGEIREILDDDSLSDFDCVEKIVNVFEAIGSNGGSRHDF